LGENECAIEIVNYPIQNDVQYDALIVRKQDSLPICIHIGKESSYKGFSATALYTKRSSLIDTIWMPIRPYLLSGNIYISMDGWFHKNNIEAMVVDDAGSLLSDIYPIIRVSSSRELVQPSNLSMKNATLFGGVSYDKSGNDNFTDTMQSVIENTNRGFVSSKTWRGNSPFEYLPYTLKEVKDIASILDEHDCNTTLYISNQASESAFKSLSGRGVQILHVSTHGIADQISDGNADPMRYCCLLLAGANNTLSNPKQTDWSQDGILTASEISALDFRGMELVVLSACNTAGGEITSEGVFGLQRAFKQAGAQSILMSLANVDDQVTSQFMIEYYAQLVNGFDKRTALARTRNIIRKKYPESIDWAAFILLD
ncbi:MAG: CHAT domain-containing protein, partial [Agathobacter sp.]